MGTRDLQTNLNLCTFLFLIELNDLEDHRSIASSTEIAGISKSSGKQKLCSCLLAFFLLVSFEKWNNLFLANYKFA